MERITIEVSPETLARARQHGEPAELFGKLVGSIYGPRPQHVGGGLPLGWPALPTQPQPTPRPSLLARLRRWLS